MEEVICASDIHLYLTSMAWQQRWWWTEPQQALHWIIPEMYECLKLNEWRLDTTHLTTITTTNNNSCKKQWHLALTIALPVSLATDGCRCLQGPSSRDTNVLVLNVSIKNILMCDSFMPLMLPLQFEESRNEPQEQLPLTLLVKQRAGFRPDLRFCRSFVNCLQPIIKAKGLGFFLRICK